jgi:SulP family sulfate permease
VAALLAPLNVAVFLGVGVSIVLYLRKAARPQMVEYEFNAEGSLAEKEASKARNIAEISIVHVEGELFFGAAELFRDQIQRIAAEPNLRIVILRLRNARHLDATAMMALEELLQFMRSKGRHLIISGIQKDAYRVLRNSGMVESLGRENIFPGSAANPNIATRNALKRAQTLLGGEKAEIRIFVGAKDKKGK